KDKLTSFNGQTITYDEIGNPITYRDGMAFTWQHGRELAGFTKVGTTASYHYNDSGIRTKKVVNGVTTEYYLNGSTILTQITGDERLDFLYDDTESLLGFLSDGESYYYVKNIQGDVIGILDSDGNQVVEYVYDVWGKVKLVSGAMSSTLGHLNPFRYRGYYFDQESGLYYLNSRYYDPQTCRFINADGLIYCEDAIPTNLFKYCDNNPVTNTDLSGFWTRGFGLNVNATAILGVSYSIGIYWDDKGSIQFLMSPEAHIGVVSAGAGAFFQWTGLETVDQLLGKSYNAGFSIGAPGYVGIDGIFQTGEEHGNDPPIGGQINGGIGIGTDIHGGISYTMKVPTMPTYYYYMKAHDMKVQYGLTESEELFLAGKLILCDSWRDEDVERAMVFWFPVKAMR
ncbi:MAG: RHS repeat-associated core domain-containing protein, partial [Clostridiales bacterium]|nr:RHS repeat-associated core domain-containing protein [Clostridiales bacterium]